MKLRLFPVLLLALASQVRGATPEELFREGAEAYQAGEFSRAARAFRDAAAQQASPGAFQNLGNAEWQRGRVGASVLAWEQALWLDPYDRNARQNLRLARDTAQIEAPQLRWFEQASTWLPANWWSWCAGLSLWFAVGLLTLPGFLRWRKAGWHQAVAALAFAVCLLCLPAMAGVRTRARLGFVLQPNTPLRLTPTQEAESVTRLGAGEPARWERERGGYLFLRTSRGAGWVERDQFGMLCPK